MASIPLPALAVKPPAQPENPMDQYAKALQVKGMMQQQQMGQVQLQQAQQQQKDQKALGQLMIKNNGNLDKVIQDAPQAGVMPNTILALQAHTLDVKTKQQAFTADQLKNFAAVHDNAAGLIQPVLDAKTPEDKDAAYQAGLKAIQSNPQMYGITDPSQMPPPQRPSDDALKIQLSVHMGQKEQAAQQMKERGVAAEEMAAQARKTAADATAGKSGPLAPPVIPQLNQGLAARWQVLNPGQPPPDWAQIQPGAKKEDFDRADKMLEQVEKAQGTKAQQDTANAMRQQAAAMAQQNAEDRRDKEGMQAVVGNDAEGNRVLVSAGDAKKMGLTGVTKADADLQNKSEAARHWLTLASKKGDTPDTMGIMQLIDKLDKEGKLGTVTSRWNDFMAGKVGAGDAEFTALRAKMGLANTKLMQAHVGSRGGAFMLEHFEDLANAKKMDASTLRSGVASELDYMKDVAMLPKSSGVIPPKGKTKGQKAAADPLGIL